MKKAIFGVQVFNLVTLAVLIVSMSIYIWTNVYVQEFANVVEWSVVSLILVNILHSILSMITMKRYED